MISTILFVALLIICVVDGFYIVGQRHEALVSRFGKYIGVPRFSGLNFKIPVIDRVDRKVSTALQQIRTELSTKTKDDQFVTLPISIQFNVTNTAVYFYDATDPNGQIADIVNAAVRKESNDKEFEELYSDREEINEKVIESVRNKMNDYGVTLRRIVIDEPSPAREVVEAYNSVRASEREKDAAKNKAEAIKITRVAEAEAEKERSALIGQGVKELRMSISESYIETRAALITAGVNEASANEFIGEAMRLDVMREIGENGNLILMDVNDQSSKDMAKIIAAAEAKQAS